MRIHVHRSVGQVAAALPLAMMIVVLLPACQSDTTDPPPAVTTGTLRVIMRTSGATLDEDGYSYRIGSATVPLAVQDSQDIEDLSAGPVEVGLRGIADNCRAFTPGPELVSIRVEQVTRVSLVVACDSALRNIVLYEHWPDNTTPELRLMRPDGSGKELFLANARSPAVTPNGTQVIYTDWPSSELWSIGSDKSSPYRLLPSLGGGQGRADVSPDGAWVVFERRTGDLTEIYRARLNGTDVQQLTAGHGDFEPRWSPDGNAIVFSRLESDNVLNVYRIPAEGGDAVRLTEGYGCCARWSPDGGRLLLMGETGLQIVATDGSDVAPVGGQPVDGPAEWSPDGSEILAEAFVGDHLEIWRMSLDGSATVTIAGEPIYNRLGRWTR